MTNFAIPEFALGQGRTFKVSTSAIANRNTPFACPMGTALQARHAKRSLQPNDAERWSRRWDDAQKLHFAIRDGFQQLGSGQPINEIVAAERNLTHAQRRFVRHALEQLQDLVALVCEASGIDVVAAQELVSSADLGDLVGEVSLFARHLASADGQTHEVVRMRLKTLKPLTEADNDWVACAALVVMRSTGDTTSRIRVADFSLNNGAYRVNFDGTPEEARALYASRGQVLQEALGGGVFNPGANCSDCNFLNVCPAVPQRGGLLGIPGRSVATRSIRASDLVAYDRCPTAFLAQRRDHLPAAPREPDDDVGAAARARGIAAHSVLRWLHERTPVNACTIDDLPDPATDLTQVTKFCDEIGIDAFAYADAYPYLLSHLEQCPLGFAGLGQWVAEPRAVVFDNHADIVVVATPDLTGETHTGEAIWRETKTTSTLPPDVESALEWYPGFALNVAMLAAEVPERCAAGFAELEVLTPTGGEVYVVSTQDLQLVTLAQKVVADITRRYAADVEFDRRESHACTWCPTYGWCQPTLQAGLSASRRAITDDEFSDDEPPF